MELSNTKLINNSCYVDGKWLKASDGSITKILNPANQEELGVVSNGGAIETNKAIKAAVIAQKKWAKTPSKEKSEVLNKLYLLMLENQEDLARIITYEQGKPLLESRGEVLYGASFIQWFAEEAKRVYGDIIPGHMGDRRTIVIKQPIGVVGCITPWNSPQQCWLEKWVQLWPLAVLWFVNQHLKHLFLHWHWLICQKRLVSQGVYLMWLLVMLRALEMNYYQVQK